MWHDGGGSPPAGLCGQAIWYYSHRIWGLFEDDYDYEEVNKFLDTLLGFKQRIDDGAAQDADADVAGLNADAAAVALVALAHDQSTLFHLIDNTRHSGLLQKGVFFKELS